MPLTKRRIRCSGIPAFDRIGEFRINFPFPPRERVPVARTLLGSRTPPSPLWTKVSHSPPRFLPTNLSSTFYVPLSLSLVLGKLELEENGESWIGAKTSSSSPFFAPRTDTRVFRSTILRRWVENETEGNLIEPLFNILFNIYTCYIYIYRGSANSWGNWLMELEDCRLDFEYRVSTCPGRMIRNRARLRDRLSPQRRRKNS